MAIPNVGIGPHASPEAGRTMEARADPGPPGAQPTSDDRSVLLALRQSGQIYRFLDLGYRYLAAVESDLQITLEVLKALVEIGLGNPARELLHQRGDLASAQLDVVQLRKAVAPIPTGRVDWKDLSATFEANLATLVEMKPGLGRYEQLLRAVPQQTQLFRDRHGWFHLSRRPVGGQRIWISALTGGTDLRGLNLRREDLVPAVAILGFPMSDLIEGIYQATAEPTPAGMPPLYLVDPTIERLSSWLHTADRRPILRDERVYLLVGPEALETFVDLLIANDDLAFPRLRLAFQVTADVAREFDQAAARVTEKRNEYCRQIVSRLQKRRSARGLSDCAQRIHHGASVLGITSRHTTMLQYSMRDIGNALQEAGFEFHQLIEAADHRQLNTLVIARAIDRLDPALVVLINHLRREQPHGLCGTPILTWVQDPVETILSAEAGASIGTRDFLCGYYRDRCLSEFGYPADRYFSVGFFPISDTVFHDGPIPEDQRDRFECDVAYVGHYHGTPKEYVHTAQRAYPEELHPVIDAVHGRITAAAEAGTHVDLDEAGRIVDEALTEALRQGPDAVRTILASFLAYRLFDIRFRLETLEWVADWAQRTGRRFRIHGAGWDRHPRLRRFAGGPVEHGEEARRAYRGAKVTIQSIPSGLTHQRTFEALLSRSLVLGRWCPVDFGDLTPAAFRAAHGDGAGFDFLLYRKGFRGLDRIVFDGPGALQERLERAVTDEPWRRALVTELREPVLEHFTYARVIPPIIELVRQSLGQGTAVSAGRV